MHMRDVPKENKLKSLLKNLTEDYESVQCELSTANQQINNLQCELNTLLGKVVLITTYNHV